MARRVLCVLGMLIATTVSARAQMLSVNGVAAPDGVSVNAGSAMAVAVSGGPGNTTDWVALSPLGAADGAYVDWR